MEKSCTTFSFTSTSVRICLSIRCFPQSRLPPGGDRSMREQRHKAWGLSWASWVQTGNQRTQGPWSLAMTAPLLCQWGGKQREKDSPLLYLKLMLKLLSLTPWSTPDGIGADMPFSSMRSQRNTSGIQQMVFHNYKKKSMAWTLQPSGKGCSEVSPLSKARATFTGLLILSPLVSKATIISPAPAHWDSWGTASDTHTRPDSLQPLHQPWTFLLALLLEGGFQHEACFSPFSVFPLILG